MREKILKIALLALLVGTLATVACASEDLPPFFGDGYDAGRSVAGGFANAPGSFGGGTGAAVSGSGGASGQSLGGAAPRFSGSGGSAEAVDGGHPCPSARPENHSSCAMPGVRCRYRLFACSCASGAWNCND